MDFMNESLRFVDLPELCKKWKAAYGLTLSDMATLPLNGLEVRFSVSELVDIYGMNTGEVRHFFDANGWSDCSTSATELIFRQSREPVDNVKPYCELELANDPEKMKTFEKFNNLLDFGTFYHISPAGPEMIKKTGGLRCKNKNRTKYDNRIYMISGRMALKTIIVDGYIDYSTSEKEAQNALETRMDELTERMMLDMYYTWQEDHGETMPKMYVYEINLPPNFTVYKDPEFDDDMCACFTNQNIPAKYIRLSWETK